jgi:hypothetical protein
MSKTEEFGMVGIGAVTGRWAKDFDRRFEVVEELLVVGPQYLVKLGIPQTAELEGAELERQTRRVLELYGITPMHEAVARNTMVSGGANLMLDLWIVAGGTGYNNANAALGAGDSAAGFSLAQTNLQGAVNTTDRVRKAMAATFPSRAANVVTFQSAFLTTDANFTWNEWALFNNVTDGSGTMANRAVTNLGTKTSASGWTLTATFTLT